MPVGARVLYLTTNSSDVRAKRDRFLGDCRLGVFAGYAVDMSPQRAYVVIDEISLLNEAKLRLVTCEQLRLLGDANGRIIYPFLAAGGTSLKIYLKIYTGINIYRL